MRRAHRLLLVLVALTTMACPPPEAEQPPAAEPPAEEPASPAEAEAEPFTCPADDIVIGVCETGVPGNATGDEPCLYTAVYSCVADAREGLYLEGCLQELGESLPPDMRDRLLNCGAGAAPGPFLREEVDGGDDPFVGGCHYSYSDAACTEGRKFAYPEICRDTEVLLENTDPNCHPPLPLDQRAVDCKAECIAKGKEGGFCTMGLAPPCEGRVLTGRCVCF